MVVLRLGVRRVTERHSAGVTPQDDLQSTLEANCFQASANAVSFGSSPAITWVIGLSVGRFCTAFLRSSYVDWMWSVFAVLTSFASATTLSQAVWTLSSDDLSSSSEELSPTTEAAKPSRLLQSCCFASAGDSFLLPQAARPAHDTSASRTSATARFMRGRRRFGRRSRATRAGVRRTGSAAAPRTSG